MNIENRELSQKLVDTIEFLKQSISKLSVYDLNYYSMTELYYGIANKINELIETYHEFGVSISEEVIKQNECLQYLLNDGLIKEVVNKINQMVADGTMDTIINHNIFNDLSSEINNIKNNFVSVKMFGAIGDGETDDTIAIQNALDYAYEHGHNVIFNTAVYKISDTIKFYPFTITDGNNSTIIQTANKPVMASIRYYDDTFESKNYVVKNFLLKGNINNDNNDGIILLGWKSTIENIEVRDVGGHGIKLTTRTIDGNEISSTTLVENRITNCKVVLNNASKICYYLSHKNNKIQMTDGFLIDCLGCFLNGSNTGTIVSIGHAGGWKIDGLHVYNKALKSVELYNCAGTQISNLNIDGFIENAVYCEGIQGTLNFSNVNLAIFGENIGSNAYAIRLAKSSMVDYANINICNINFRFLSTPSNLLTGIRLSEKLNLNIKNITHYGDNSKFTKFYKATTDSTITYEDIVLENNNSYSLNGKLITTTSYVTGYGNSEKTLTVDLPTQNSSSKFLGELTIFGANSGNEGLFYKGNILIVNSSGNTYVNLHNLTNLTGLSGTPTVSYNNSQLTISFTPSVTNNTYIATFEIKASS